MIGFPYDIGVARNGGRVGARDGPKWFHKLIFERRTGTAINPELGIDLTSLEIGNLGMIEEGLTLEDAHQKLTTIVKSVLDAGSIPFIVGGGNDQSYPNASALLSKLQTDPSQSLGVINIDAHLDVRPRTRDNLVHSGTPFRELLEDPRFLQGCSNSPNSHHFIEFAAQGSQCAASHADYVLKKNGKIVWLSQIQRAGSAKEVFVETLERIGGDKIFVSFDLDAVCGGDAPGVSAPSPMGLTAKDALDICFESGRNPKVAMFDLSEFNPHIEDYRTARFTAMMFYYFLMGLATRFTNK
uniref:Arginase n=1 Tax=Arcella intermedia TaxID=1963864 RepID=A0A6B2LAM9_9EUKA